MKQNLSINNLLKQTIDSNDYNFLQLEELKKGLEAGIVISFYANPNFNFAQMLILRCAIEDGYDVSPYADPTLDWEHMRAYHEAQIDGLDISQFTNVNAIQKQLESQKNETESLS